jgi:hypothetical protein
MAQFNSTTGALTPILDHPQFAMYARNGDDPIVFLDSLRHGLLPATHALALRAFLSHPAAQTALDNAPTDPDAWFFVEPGDAALAVGAAHHGELTPGEVAALVRFLDAPNVLAALERLAA